MCRYSIKLAFFAYISVLFLVAGEAISAAPTGGAGGLAQLELISESIVGVVLFPDGETPVENLPIRVWDIDNRRMIYKSNTDADGVFRIPKLATQRCNIFVGKVQIDMRMLAEKSGTVQQAHNIVVVLSRPMLIAGRSKLLDVTIAPLLMLPPEAPKIVSP